MFSFIYGYACGIGSNNSCATERDYGSCSFGEKNDLHLDKLSNELIYPFGEWITKLLSELAFLHTVCLPVTQDTCSSETDDVSNAITVDLVSAFEEVGNNINFAANCMDKGFLICKIGEDGMPIPHSSPKFEEAVATSVFSSNNPRALVNSVTQEENGESFSENIMKAHKGLSLWSHILPSGKLNNDRFVEGRIKYVKDEALQYLGELKIYQEETFAFSTLPIGNILDEEIRNIEKIRTAFQNYVDATLGEYSSANYQHSLKPRYTEAFR